MSFLIAGCLEAPNTSETKEYSNRFADFNSVLTIQRGVSGGNANIKWIEKIAFKLEPTRVGSYFIQASGFEAKFNSVNGPDTPPVSYDIPITTKEIVVFYSDGKSFEKTPIKIE